ncbi:MAG: molecular chaperone SurA [Legionellales bacterium RIFCSPHIGHO2_12_FULL_37_14]|nr:MAG: molecular chaperone SurA [Legionellales bacterium RIFCSPHIGHO2_12_FULL_37_14]
MFILRLIALFCLISFAYAKPLDTVVAVVNDEVITLSELNQQVDLLRQQLTAKKVSIPEDAVLKKQVLQHLIDVNLQLQLAKQHGMKIEDPDLDDTIKKIADNNNISIENLKMALKAQGMEWTQYRENIRKEIMLARMQQQAVANDIQISQNQVETYLKQAKQQRHSNQLLYHIQNIVVPLSNSPTSEELLKAKAKAQALLTKLKQGADFNQLAIAESSDAFALEGGDLGDRHLAEMPEVFAKAVVEMKVGEVSDPIRTGNGFQLIKLVGITGEPVRHMVTKTHVRHILIKPDVSMTKEEARLYRNRLHHQLRGGGDFARFAKQYSLDPVSALKGGDLGWVVPGDLVPEFEKAMDKLAINEISRPVKSRYGWHFIQVLGRKQEDDTKAYEKQQVRQFLHQRKFTEAVETWQQRLRGQAYIKVFDKELA